MIEFHLISKGIQPQSLCLSPAAPPTTPPELAGPSAWPHRQTDGPLRCSAIEPPPAWLWCLEYHAEPDSAQGAAAPACSLDPAGPGRVPAG
jgi:hypothetical protein